MSTRHAMRILVTGGAGFIGGHVVDALIQKGYRVRVLDHLAPPTHNGRLPKWFNPHAEFLRGDVRKKSDWIKALEGVDAVIHLAAYMDFHLDFSTYVSTNIESVALLFEVAVEKKYPLQKIIMASSQSVYGEGSYRCSTHGVHYPPPRSEEALRQGRFEHVCPEDGSSLIPIAERETDPLLPTIPYGISKKAAEDLLFSLGRLYRIPAVALRYTIVHGARQSFRHFYSGALRQIAVMALGGEPIVLHEDGNQIRDYVNVHDVVEAHLVALEDERANFEAFNVGSGKETRVHALAETILREAGVSAKIQTPGLFRVGAPRHSPADISKLRALGWKPAHTLADGVRAYLDWIKQFPEAKQFLADTLRDMRKKHLLK